MAEPPRPEGPYPTCTKCGAEVVALMSRTEKNPNRWFFKCPTQDNSPGHFWSWVDTYKPAAGGAAGGGGGAGAHAAQAPGGAQPQAGYHQQQPLQHAPSTPGANRGGPGATYGPAHGAYGGAGAGPSQQPPYGHQPQQHQSPQFGGATLYGGATQYGSGTQFASPQRQGPAAAARGGGGGAASAAGGAPPTPHPATPQQQQPLRQPNWQSPTQPPSQSPHAQPPQTQAQARAQGYINPYSTQQAPPPDAAAAPQGVGQGMPVYIQVLEAGGGGDIAFSTPVFHEPFRDVFMQLPKDTGRHWDPAIRGWRVHAAAYMQAKELLWENGYRVEDAPYRVISALVHRNGIHNPKMSVEEARGFVESRVDPALWGRLFPYQREGVVAGARLGGRLLLADEMGLGKTVQALTLLSCYPEDWPLLIICPTSLRYTWAAAIQEWLPAPLRPAPRDLWVISASADWDKLARRAADEEDWAAVSQRRSGSQQQQQQQRDGYGDGAEDGYHPPVGVRPHIAIVSYDLATKMKPEYKSRYRSVVCDESHMLKSRQTARYKAVAPMVKQARRAVLCTGTPLLNRPIEVWPQVDLLRPSLLGSFTEFGERYCLSPQAFAARQQQQQQQQQQQRAGGGWGRGGGGGGGWGGPWPGSEYTGCCQVGELHALLAECVMVRRLKSAVLKDLPPKIRSKVPLQPSSADLQQVARELKRLKEVQAAAARGELAEREADMQRKQAWSAAYRATGPAKCAEAIAFIDQLLHIGTDEEEAAAATQPDAQQARSPGGRRGAGRRGRGAAAGGGGGGAAAAAAGGASGGGEGGEGGGGGGGGGGPAKVLVFAHHQEVLDRLSEHMKQKRVGTVRIDGHTPPPQRDKAVADFQRTGDRTPRVALLSLHAAGAGLTLTAASVVVFVELDQAPSILAQAEDRAHRVGQGSHVHVYYLMGRGTLDEQIWAMLERKKFVMGATLDGERKQPPPGDGGGDGDEEDGASDGGGPPPHDMGFEPPPDPFSGGDGTGDGDGDDTGAGAGAAGGAYGAAGNGSGGGGAYGYAAAAPSGRSTQPSPPAGPAGAANAGDAAWRSGPHRYAPPSSPPHPSQHGSGPYGSNPHLAAVLAEPYDPDDDLDLDVDVDALLAQHANGGSQHSTNNRNADGVGAGAGGAGTVATGFGGGRSAPGLGSCAAAAGGADDSAVGAGGASVSRKLFGEHMELPPLPAAAMAARAALARAGVGAGAGAGTTAATDVAGKGLTKWPPPAPPAATGHVSLASNGSGGGPWGVTRGESGLGPVVDLTQSDGEEEGRGAAGAVRGQGSGSQAGKRQKVGSGGSGSGGSGGVGAQRRAGPPSFPVIELE